jgi:glucose/arabinose dehydrogenase
VRILRRRISVLVAATVAAAIAGAFDARAAVFGTVPVKTGLDFPAAFTFAPDGRIFYGERFTGEIRVFDPRNGSDTLFYTVPNLSTTGEQGLLGLELHPNYPTTPWVYAYATRIVSGQARNQILRLVDDGGIGTRQWAIFGAPAGSNHNGGRILFGPDSRLYAVIGENGFAARSQDLTTTVGKILRMTARGGVPADNPFAGSYVYAYGIRNSFGFAFDPVTGRMWETDNGPTCNDELNRIVRGRNYGWGSSFTCATPPEPPANTNQDGANPHLPRLWYATSNAPTGVAFCQGCRLGSGSEGRLFFAAWKTRELHRVTLGTTRWDVVSDRVKYTHVNRILSLEVAPNGTLYLSDGAGIYKITFS